MKKKPPNPVHEPAKDAFDLYVAHWQERLGLNDWRIVRSLKKPRKTAMAEVQVFYPDRLANYRVSDDFGAEPVNERTVEEIALHEVLHVFLAELKNQVDYGIDDTETLDSAEHRAINVLVKLLIGGG